MFTLPCHGTDGARLILTPTFDISTSHPSTLLPCQALTRVQTKMTARKAIVVGISGCSSSGKTTLSRLLRDIFPNTFVLHEDDFYRAETE